MLRTVRWWSQERVIDYLSQVAAKCLTDNRELPVFFLHDSTREGIRWANEIQQGPSRLPWEQHTKIDIGLTPEDVKKLKTLRPLRPALREYELPVDSLPYTVLETGLRGAFEELAPFSALIANQEHGYGSDTTTHFG